MTDWHEDIRAVEGHTSSGYYQTFEVRSLAAVRSLFQTPCDYTLNWLFLSTSGVHGTYTTLDDFDRSWDNEDEMGGEPPHRITVLVVQPRVCRLYFGFVEVEKPDLPWLREMVGRSIQGILASQRENLPREVYHQEGP